MTEQDVVAVPLYKSGKFLITAAVVVITTGLLVWHFVSDATWADVLKFVVSAYLGGSNG